MRHSKYSDIVLENLTTGEQLCFDTLDKVLTKLNVKDFCIMKRIWKMIGFTPITQNHRIIAYKKDGSDFILLDPNYPLKAIDPIKQAIADPSPANMAQFFKPKPRQ